MLPIIDLTKGHHDHGKLTVHTNPDICPNQGTVTNHMTVQLRTAVNGINNGQWTPCPDCTRRES